MGVAVVDIDGRGIVTDIEDDVMVALAMAADDEQAAEAGTWLLERYEGMIRSIAAQYFNRGDIVEELVVTGFAAILDALDVYTPAVGVQTARSQCCVHGDVTYCTAGADVYSSR